MARVSTLDHWESYWKGHQQDIDDTYSTRDRLVREVLADGPVRARSRAMFSSVYLYESRQPLAAEKSVQ